MRISEILEQGKCWSTLNFIPKSFADYSVSPTLATDLLSWMQVGLELG